MLLRSATAFSRAARSSLSAAPHAPASATVSCSGRASDCGSKVVVLRCRVRWLQGTIQRGLSDTHRASDRTGRFSTLDERPRMINLRSGQRRPPAKVNSALLRCLDSGLRPLDDQAALELRQSAHDVHDQASARTRGVDRVGQAAEVDFACAELGDERNQVREGSPKPVQFPDNEGVARAEGG